MGGRVIQGFFLGGGRLAPATSPMPRGAVQRLAAPVGRSGPPPSAFVGEASAIQQRPAPGRPPLVHATARGQVAQRFGGDGSFAIDPVQVGLARSGGIPLPNSVLAKMEAAFGADFSAVRVHVGPQASRIGAIAFTTGNDLYFAPGQFQPDSAKGQQLIGHELAHVIQQRAGRVRAPGSGVAVVQDRALEAEADRLGMRAAAHQSVVQRRPAMGRTWGGSAALQRSAAPKSMANYTVTTMGQHKKDVANGADQMALALFDLNPNPVAKAKANVLIIPTVDIASRVDADHMEVSVENIETRMWENTKQMHARVANGQSISSHKAKQTEVVGEAAAINAFAKKYPTYEMAFGTDPGHGAGIDQLWIRRGGGGVIAAYMIVEAKGPGQTLAHAQMSAAWIASRIQTLTGNGDAIVAAAATAVQVALASPGGVAGNPHVEGCVITAVYHDASGSLRHSVSNKQSYN